MQWDEYFRKRSNGFLCLAAAAADDDDLRVYFDDFFHADSHHVGFVRQRVFAARHRHPAANHGFAAVNFQQVVAFGDVQHGRARGIGDVFHPFADKGDVVVQLFDVGFGNDRGVATDDVGGDFHRFFSGRQSPEN